MAPVSATRHVRVEFFNLHEQGTLLLAEHLALTPASDPHLVVVGLGQLGRALVVSAAQQWAELGDSPLVATLVDLEGDSRWQGMVMQHPALREAVEPTLLAFDVDSPTEEALAALTDRLKARRPSLVAVVLDDESLALSTGLSASAAGRRDHPRRRPHPRRRRTRSDRDR